MTTFPRRLIAALVVALTTSTILSAPAAHAGETVNITEGTGTFSVRPWNTDGGDRESRSHGGNFTVPAGKTWLLNSAMSYTVPNTNADHIEVSTKLECSNGVKLTSSINALKGTTTRPVQRGAITGPATCNLVSYYIPHNRNSVPGNKLTINTAGSFIQQVGGDMTGTIAEGSLTSTTLVSSYSYLRSPVLTVPTGYTKVGGYLDAGGTSCYNQVPGANPGQSNDPNCAGARITSPTQFNSKMGYELYIDQLNADGTVCTRLGTKTGMKEVIPARHHEDQFDDMWGLSLSPSCNSRKVRATYRAISYAGSNSWYLKYYSPTNTGGLTRVGVHAQP